MSIKEIRVAYTERDARGESVLHEARRVINVPSLENVRTARVYRVEGVSDEEAAILRDKLFYEPIGQKSTIDRPVITDTPHVVEVAYQPGVMNPEAASIMKSANDLGIYPQAADSSTEYAFYGNVMSEDVQAITKRLLVNSTVERIVTEKPETLLITGETGPVNSVPIRYASEDTLMALSKDKLFLDLSEMQVVQSYFNELARDPTDCELEIIAARWSEHCSHKTFNARVIINGVEKAPLFTRIKDTARDFFGDEVVSAFGDNSGVYKFYDGQAICGKVETHNSPSAIEPYGGAATGSGGVFRDILGTGQGAKVIVSTDMFCFAPPDMDPEKIPTGSLKPDYLQRRVVAGVGDYGNRMGIPTNNGSVHYHEDFRAKPTVIVGSYGILPEERAQKGKPEVNDFVFVIGGKTGRDGIHGATFSSSEMTDRTISVNSSAVQIGNAIEEKRMADAIIEARDQDLIRAITDCGAAGFSSAIGEMGEDTGVLIDLSLAPTKYPGLAPWEIWLSESQERMILAIEPSKVGRFLDVCRKYNVDATALGFFDDSNKLKINYGETQVADLSYDFLKNGLPQRVMEGKFQPVQKEDELPEEPVNWVDSIKKVLSHGNVASKEPILRLYDHGVQGTNALSPFSGVEYDGPNDAVVITPILDRPYGMVVSHGMNPILNRIDPYNGSVWAAAEAMANYVAVGGNPDEAALINNYIWPTPDIEAMGSLDMSVDAVVDFMKAVGRPVISGKDSLSSTYRGKDGQVIKIPPVLCISVFGRIPDVGKTVTSDLKKEGSTLVVVGKLDRSLGGSVYYETNNVMGNSVPRVDLEILPTVLRKVYSAINSGRVLSSHDISEGGVITTVAEMAFGGGIGVELTLPENQKAHEILFNETAGCFIIETENENEAEELFGDVPHFIIGKTQREKTIKTIQGEDVLFSVDTQELKSAWQEPLRRIFA